MKLGPFILDPGMLTGISCDCGDSNPVATLSVSTDKGTLSDDRTALLVKVHADLLTVTCLSCGDSCTAGCT